MSIEAPYVDGSATSAVAAQEIEADAATLRGQLAALLRASGPMTDDEMQVVTGMNPSTQRPRRVELWKAGVIMKTMERRKTRSGRPAAVWKYLGP